MMLDNECTIGAGASSLIFAAIQALVHPGDEVVVQSPAYDLYGPAVQLAGGQLIEVPLLDASGNWDLEAPARAMPAPRWSSSTRRTTPRARPALQVSWMPWQNTSKAPTPWCSATRSTAHRPRRPSRSSSLAASNLREQGLAFGSFGKLLQVTGWKIGWAVGPPPLTAELRKGHQYDVFSTGAPLQAALAHFLPTTEGVAHLDGLAAMYQAKRDRLLAGLAGTPWRFTPAQGGFFQVLDARDIVRRRRRPLGPHVDPHPRPGNHPPLAPFARRPHRKCGSALPKRTSHWMPQRLACATLQPTMAADRLHIIGLQTDLRWRDPQANLHHFDGLLAPLGTAHRAMW